MKPKITKEQKLKELEDKTSHILEDAARRGKSGSWTTAKALHDNWMEKNFIQQQSMESNEEEL